MQQIKLIVSDIDGTLLNSHAQLSPANESALKQALAQGIGVILATGRARTPKTVQIYEQLGLRSPLICLQGAAVHDSDGSHRFLHLLERRIAKSFIRLSQDKGYSLVVYSGLDLYTTQIDDNIRVLERHQEPTPIEIGDWANLPADLDISKLIVFDPNLPQLRQNVQDLAGLDVQVLQTLPTALEIIPAQVSKGAAMAEICADLGISLENVMALGDAENDISMIQMAGFGVAMGNAFDSVKAVADHVTSSNNEDGLAAAVRQFALG